MLAFDIETTGLDPNCSRVTVVCTECFHTGEKVAYEFERVSFEEPHNYNSLVQEMIQAFNQASSLCAFNGIQFDLHFLQEAFQISDGVMTSWMLKTTDILEACRLQMFGPRHTFSLNLLCEVNGLPMKSSTGTQAIVMANERRWEDLRVYCADDVSILCNLYRKRKLKNPRGHDKIDCSLIAHPDLYVQEHKISNHISLKVQKADIHTLTELLKAKDQEIERLRAQLKIYAGFCTCLD